MGDVLLVRHGETEWSRAHKHTGRTDVPLTDAGRRQARMLRGRLEGRSFELVLTSPLGRARETCELAGLGARADMTDDLLEWDYGDYEGLTTAEIRRERPGWVLWRDGCPNGETAAQVGLRADTVIAALRRRAGDSALFAHGHLLRVLTARWLELQPESGALFALSPATLCVLGYEHGGAAIWLWNSGAEPGIAV